MVLTAQPVPMMLDADGVIRVGGTRVTLDTIVLAFAEGMTPEGIAQQYPSVALADLYSVIGYVLAHADEVEEYLKKRRGLAAAVRAENEAKFDPNGIRARLLARRR